ncbi:MAG: hypothetical protein LBJ22_00455 [Synergistaceae bacterium]|jgi:hypothetical protein|nr:hypothetical protein [Synergistaceae bacterium]
MVKIFSKRLYGAFLFLFLFSLSSPSWAADYDPSENSPFQTLVIADLKWSDGA